MVFFVPLPTSTHGVDRVIRREQHSLYNCLLSILDDSRFVDDVRRLYPGVPVFANLRCGLWYTAGGHDTCYFKSTDGHFGNWSFSSTRLNLHVAQACCVSGGCLIIDATRTGKSFPVCLCLIKSPLKMRNPLLIISMSYSFAFF
jgi:tRNA A64-2'-O-ribosylphosphate transferase